MTRNEAIKRLHDAIAGLPSGPRQAAARRALQHLLVALERGARKDVAEARDDLLASLPGLKPAVDRTIADRFTAPTPIPRKTRKRRG